MIIYLAGSETPVVNYKWSPLPKTNVFVSYYQQRAGWVVQNIKRQSPKGLMTIDSGAHSFFGFFNFSATSHIRSKVSLPDPKTYFKAYLKWLVENEAYYDYFVELDIQEIVGLDQVKKWRKEYAAAGLARRAIEVYHNCDTWKEFERLANEAPSRYIGTEGVRKGRQPLPFLKMIRYAYEHSCRIHGFAMIKRKFLETLPFYSIDSSSWSAAWRYGMLATFNQKTGWMQQIKLRPGEMHRRLLLPKRLDGTHAQVTGQAGGYWAAWAERAYRQLEAHLTAVWKMRGVDWEKAMKHGKSSHNRAD